jgi:hypothetical protein
MNKAHVLLRDDQTAELERVSRQTGRKSELIRRGVDLALAEAKTSQPASPAEENDDWKAAWRGIFGLWADRDDIDELYSDLRRRNRERMERLEKQWRKE